MSYIHPYACPLIQGASVQIVAFVNSVVRQLMQDTCYSLWQVCRILSNFSAFGSVRVSGRCDIFYCCRLKPLGTNCLLCVSKDGKLFEKYHCHLYKLFPYQAYYLHCAVWYGIILLYSFFRRNYRWKHWLYLRVRSMYPWLFSKILMVGCEVVFHPRYCP